jgi:hypothetical protein
MTTGFAAVAPSTTPRVGFDISPPTRISTLPEIGLAL